MSRLELGSSWSLKLEFGVLGFSLSGLDGDSCSIANCSCSFECMAIASWKEPFLTILLDINDEAGALVGVLADT